VIQDELALAERLRQQKYEYVLRNLPYVTSIEGRAAFVSPQEVVAEGKQLRAKRFVIAAVIRITPHHTTGTSAL